MKNRLYENFPPQPKYIIPAPPELHEDGKSEIQCFAELMMERELTNIEQRVLFALEQRWKPIPRFEVERKV